MERLAQPLSKLELPDQSAELAATKLSLQHQVENPLGGDVRSAAFAKAMLYLLDGKSYADEMGGHDTRLQLDNNDTDLTAILEETIYWRTMPTREAPKPFVPSAFTGLTMRAIQADRLEHPGKDDDGFIYPGDYVRPQAWVSTLKNILADLPRAEQFFLRTMSYDLLSNVPQRGVALELAARALQESGALTKNPTTYHVGCSQQELEKKIAYKHQYPYKKIEVTNGERISRSVAHKLNKKIAKRWYPRLQVGFDLNFKDDPRIQAYAKACSFYPSELLDAQRAAEYDDLGRRNPHSVHFIQGDFLEHSPGQVAQRLAEPQLQADIVFFSFSLYQHAPDRQAAMLEHAKKHLSPAGWIFVLDFVRPDPQSPTGMYFEPDWSAGSYLCRLLAISGNDPNSTPHEMFVFENGRIERLRLGMGLVAARNAGRKL